LIPGKARVAAGWLLALPYLLFAAPTRGPLVVGAVIAVLGLLIRGWAAGTLDKGQDLATTGPYAHTRNPLYFGSFVLGLGLAVAGGHWVWPVVFLVFFAAVYGPTMNHEAKGLSERFGNRFREYAAVVPLFFPRLIARASARVARDRFQWSRYLRYREWEAALGAAAALVVLSIKLRLGA
jgi:protein-S-isoprenylcysteine O-methyltransferase Ste14